MKYKLIILLFFLNSCAQSIGIQNKKITFNSKGFAYIYDESDYYNKIIDKKMDNNLLQIAHNKLKPGSKIKLINPKTNDSIILKNLKRIEYPDYYKILITEPVAKHLKLTTELPLIEVIEIKKNKSFIAQKTKIFVEEKTIHSNAPVELVKIDNISKNQNKKSKSNIDKIFIVIANFYNVNSANLLKKRITQDLKKFDSKKLNIKLKETNKITLLSGPYSSINLMKNDYILLKSFGFEELDITINE